MFDFHSVMVLLSVYIQAKEIYHQTNGKQQVLPLDSIYRKNLPDWSKWVTQLGLL